MKQLKDGTVVPDSTPTKSTSAGRVLLTAEEIAEHKKRATAWEAGRAMREWSQEMSNHPMSDREEKILDLFSTADRARLDVEMLAEYASKKLLKSQKPE